MCLQYLYDKSTECDADQLYLIMGKVYVKRAKIVLSISCAYHSPKL